jgi:hypothetical protein
MIDAVLKFLADEVNAYQLRRTGDAEHGLMIPARLVDDSGNTIVADEHLALSLFQVEEERVLRQQLPERVLHDNRELTQAPALRINLLLIVAARFATYSVALARLALAMRCFQARSLFTAADAPGLPEGLERLSIEMVNLSLEQMNQLWACVGARQLPSAVYRVRLLELRETEPLGSGQPVLHIDTRLGPL